MLKLTAMAALVFAALAAWLENNGVIWLVLVISAAAVAVLLGRRKARRQENLVPAVQDLVSIVSIAAETSGVVRYGRYAR